MALICLKPFPCTTIKFLYLFQIFLQFNKSIIGGDMEYKFINIEYLDTVSGGEPEIIGEIVTMFKEQSVEIYNEMKSHLSTANFGLLGALAHKAKSSVLIMGMTDLAQMLKTLELQAKSGAEPEKYESYITRFKNETDAAVAELEDLVSNRLKK
jgi:HPt (histidine-containing phosphotransfer) domain-containing protein